MRWRPLVISLVVCAAAAFLPLGVSGYVLGLLTIAFYFGVFSMAWDLLFGFANEVNFGPTFLIGLGAYTAGILDNLYGPPIFVCVAAGALAAVIGGVVLALPALRVRGPYFGLTTLVAVLMLQNFVVVAADLTGGEIGLTIPDVISISDKVNYWIALGFMTVSGLVLYGLSRSPVGLILQASGQDAVQAGALGFNIVKHKLASFIVSALFSGLAGALMAFYLGAASVGTFIDVTVGVQVIVGAVLGGRRTILGGAIGAIFLIAAGEALRPLGDLATFIVSAHRARRGARLSRRLLRDVRRPTGRGMSALEITNLSKRFGGLAAVRDISFRCREGRDPRPHRPQRLRQVDGDEVDPRHREADQRLGEDRRRRKSPAGRRTRSPGSASAWCSSTRGPCTARPCSKTSNSRCCRIRSARLLPDPAVERRAREIAERVGLAAVLDRKPSTLAVRGSAPHRTRQGDRARSAGRAGRRTFRGPHRARNLGLRRTDLGDAPRRPRGADRRPQREERRLARRSRVRHVCRRAHRGGHARRK